MILDNYFKIKVTRNTVYLQMVSPMDLGNHCLAVVSIHNYDIFYKSKGPFKNLCFEETFHSKFWF